VQRVTTLCVSSFMRVMRSAPDRVSRHDDRVFIRASSVGGTVEETSACCHECHDDSHAESVE
jgi:hypothetical protein